MARAIKISSVSGALTVAITGPNGGTPVVYADSSFSATQSMPATIADTATTTFWLQGPGRYTLSVKTSGGTEIAADNNSTRTVDLETDGTVAALNYDARTLATVSGDSGHSTAGSAASGAPQNFVSKTANYTALVGDFIEADATSAPFTITLPSNPLVGVLVAFKKIDATSNGITVVPAGSGNIDGDVSASTTTRWAGAIFEHKGSDVWRVEAVTSAAGPTGPQGNAATVAVGSVTTGAAGSSANVTNSGTSASATLNFTIPRGDTGAAGANGAVSGVQYGGAAQTVRPTLNFTGAGVTVADNAGATRTDITISGTATTISSPTLFGVATGQFMRVPQFYSVQDGGTAATDGQLHAVPFLLTQAVTVTKLGVLLWANASVGGVVRLGLYNDNGSGYPGTLIVDAGTLDATTGFQVNKTITLGSSQVLNPGTYWAAAVSQGAPATKPTLIRSTTVFSGTTILSTNVSSNIQAYQLTGISGALPGPFTAGATGLVGGASGIIAITIGA